MRYEKVGERFTSLINFKINRKLKFFRIENFGTVQGCRFFVIRRKEKFVVKETIIIYKVRWNFDCICIYYVSKRHYIIINIFAYILTIIVCPYHDKPDTLSHASINCFPYFKYSCNYYIKYDLKIIFCQNRNF